MDEVAATVGRRPTLAPLRHSSFRSNKFNIPSLPVFADEAPLSSEGEPTHGLDDVLLSGSDDEYYDSPGARSRRLEEQARLFLQGCRPRLLSASLRGPFTRESGWENPWRGRRSSSKIAKKASLHSTKAQRPSTESTAEAGVGMANSKQQPAQSEQTAQAAPAAVAAASMAMAPTTRSSSRASRTNIKSKNSKNDLGTTPITDVTEKNPEAKKRAAGTDWLRRKNLKRLRSSYDDNFAASPSASRSTRAASMARTVAANAANAPKTPENAPAASDPAQGDPTEEIIEDSMDQSIGVGLSVSHISDSEPAMSLPSELFRSSHVEAEPTSQQQTTHMDESTTSERCMPEPVQEDVPTTFGDDTTLLSAEQDVTNEPESIPDKPEPAVDAEPGVDAPKPTEDDTSIESTEPAVALEEAQNTSNFADTTSTTCAMDIVTDEETAQPKAADDTDMGDARLATQDQSPWVKAQTNIMLDEIVTDSPTNIHPEDINEPATLTTQSPWSRETQPVFPTTTDVEATNPELATNETDRPPLSLSQNPWAEASAAAASFSSTASNLPTSPTSPGMELPQIEKQDGEHDHEQEPFLPSLPILNPTVAHSSGTAPSTPDTKQSSLPTPDMTVSIKSFRRFRSPTPTPPPRKRSSKKGGPKSILSQPRRRSGASGTTASSAKLGRRVHFSLPGDEESTVEGNDDSVNGTEVAQPQRAASPPPQDKVLMESLPTEVDRFKGHFATMAGRTRSQQAALPASAKSKYSASQSTDTTSPQVQSASISKTQDPALDLELYSSPSVDAMASRFQEADAETSKLQQISSGQSRQSSVSQHTGDGKATGANGGDNKENAATHGQAGENNSLSNNGADAEDDAESVVDDVQDVMDNLGDFLGLWDMDAELAQASAGNN